MAEFGKGPIMGEKVEPEVSNTENEVLSAADLDAADRERSKISDAIGRRLMAGRILGVGSVVPDPMMFSEVEDPNTWSPKDVVPKAKNFEVPVTLPAENPVGSVLKVPEAEGCKSDAFTTVWFPQRDEDLPDLIVRKGSPAHALLLRLATTPACPGRVTAASDEELDSLVDGDVLCLHHGPAAREKSSAGRRLYCDSCPWVGDQGEAGLRVVMGRMTLVCPECHRSGTLV